MSLLLVLSFDLVVDILECRMSDGGVEFSDSRSSYATEPGQVRVQWKLWVSTVYLQQFRDGILAAFCWTSVFY